METENNLPKKFMDAMADVPEMPGHLYDRVLNKIDTKNRMKKLFWALAASFVIAAGTLPFFLGSSHRDMLQPDITEELSTISSFYNDENASDESSGYSVLEVGLY